MTIPLDRRSFVLRTILAITASAAATPPAGAQAGAESRGLQLVVPAPPGSQPDLLARWLVEPLAATLGVPGLVVNRPGAAGALAADAVLEAPPQAGALLLGGLDHVAYSHLNGNRRALDPFRDFAPAGTVNRDSWLLVVPANSPASDFAGLVAATAGGTWNYPSTGEGSTAHLLTARLGRAAGIEAQHVPYKDAWLPDLIAGRVQFALAPVPAVIAQLRARRLRALASLTRERLTLLDAVPSISELGHADQVFHGGLFLFAPAASAATAPRVNVALVAALRRPDIARHYEEAGIEPTPFDLEQTRRLVAERLRTVDEMRLAVFGRGR